MKIFGKTGSTAGTDQVNAIEESINTQIEQMFNQVAKKRTLAYGVDRTIMTGSNPDNKMRLDAQSRECDAGIVFHAGRALELALHLLYARGADRILGREYPGVPDDQVKEERRTHSLVSLHARIVNELEGRNVGDALENVYQHALHKGIVDIIIDGNWATGFYWPENKPFKETRVSKIMDGAEMTLDHLEDTANLIGLSNEESDFSKMPEDTFTGFLAKADCTYYGEKNMHWARYSARDHEYGRPYVVIGSEFFGRLVQGIVQLSNQREVWDKSFSRRFHERRQYNIIRLMEAHANQNFDEPIEFPPMISIDEAMERYRVPLQRSRSNYDFLHQKLELNSKRKSNPT